MLAAPMVQVGWLAWAAWARSAWVKQCAANVAAGVMRMPACTLGTAFLTKWADLV